MTSKRQMWFMKVMAVICSIAVIIMVVVLFIENAPKKSSTFSPPPFESAAQSGIPNVPEDLGWDEIDAKAYRLSICGGIQINDNKADVYFTNPVENDVWMKLRILDSNEKIIAETGLIRSGEYVQSILFTTIPEDGNSVKLKVMAYEPNTYYSAGCVILNTVVDQ